MKIWKMALVCGALALTAGVVALHPQPVQAQGTTFPDVPENHWAYQAVTDLANAGYVKGYPDGSFLGKRAMTRYEFATVIDRIVSTVSDLSAKVNSAAMVTPTGTPVTQDDLNKIQVLVDTFQPELDAIKSNVTDLQAQLDALRQDVLDTKAYALKANTAAAKAQATANNSYGVGTGRKFTISGYIQTRYVAADSGDPHTFPQGFNGNSSSAGPGIAGAFNGTYAQGGSRSTEEVRRARILFAGSPTDNTSYRAQLDFSGAVTTAANQQTTVREANGTYTFGDGTSKYPALTAGLFATPFGYILPGSTASCITPERPLAFSEGNNVGLFDSQDYSKGVKAAYSLYNVTATYALITDGGRQAETNDNHGDSVIRLAYASPTKIFTVGTSYYNGLIYRTRPTAGLGSVSLTYPEPKKELFGLDGQANYKSFFLNGEFVKGTYEKRSYFDSTLGAFPANPLGFEVDGYVKNNQVQGAYAEGGYTFFSATPRPLTLAAEYDVFQRSISSHSNALNALQGNNVGGTYQPSGSSFDDVNVGYGALYNLDKATRLRLWYERPFAVAHLPGTSEPPRYGLYTAEMQFKY